MRYRLLVFDWDGTLHDSVAHITTCLQAAAADVGLAVPDDRSARHIIGLGLDDALQHLFPGLPLSRYPALVDRYRAHFLATPETGALFDGAAEALAEFEARGHLLAVATGKSRAGLDRVLALTGLDGRFHATRCADEGLPKPNPDMLFALLRTTGIDAREALMVGDTTHDLDMARAAGVDAIAVAYGAHPRETLSRAAPAALVDTPRALWRWLRTNA
jgi:phosphoglycolate phosphatase